MERGSHNKAHEFRASQDHPHVYKYRIASLCIEISCLYGYAFSAFRNYRAAFLRPDLSVEITQEDIDRERLNRPELEDPGISVEDDRVAVTFDYGCLEPSIAMTKAADQTPRFDTFLFHGATVEKDGFAYIFTAPSGVGKTTRIRLWLDSIPDSAVVNGDKPFIRMTGEEAIACGSPWCGKEGWNSNVMVPIRAIFLLERAGEGESTTVREVSLGEAFPFLLQQTYRPSDPELQRKTIRLLQAFEGKVRFYRFRSTPTPEAVRLAYETARPR